MQIVAKLKCQSLEQWKIYCKDYYKADRASQVVLGTKNLPANAGDVKRHGFDPWVGKIPWKRACQPTPMFLPGESLGQRSLAGYSPWDSKGRTWQRRLSMHKNIQGERVAQAQKTELSNRFQGDFIGKTWGAGCSTWKPPLMGWWWSNKVVLQ